MRGPALASLGPLLGGAAVGGARGAAGADSDDSSEDGARGFPATWGRPTINGHAASAPIGGNDGTPFMQPVRSIPPPPPWGAPVQEAGPPDMGQHIAQALSSAGGQRDPLVALMALQLMTSLKAKEKRHDSSDSSGLETIRRPEGELLCSTS